MNIKQHRKRHIKLHGNLDELLADFIANTDGRLNNSILDMVKWSHKQTVEVDHHKNMVNLEEVER